MTKLTLTELAAESVELLPSRDTLLWDGNLTAILASNLSLAANVGTVGSSASSLAVQWISVNQH
ncbi:hypothetical protein RBS60_02670 [Sinomonas sp. ASV486]|uniref:hypothetical protein n=1 Tax=Sinomonas sp. ASV486 TaxID=3051170 RepID=UPI0027DC6AF4|nr:hypothetical protein [Sinomonas sp. ASV486]MDQ4489100.1 hypothetical protein [Sinomonas sp. ASV486]